MSKEDVRIVVCVACRDAADQERRPGAAFLDALRERLTALSLDIPTEAVECLAVCKRPATIALSARGKWTYVIGDISPETLDDVIEAAQRYGESENGIVAWKDRPVCFRKGVVSRTPPIP